MGNWLKLLGMAAASGAIQSIAVGAVAPEVQGDPAALGIIALVGALNGAGWLLKTSPFAPQKTNFDSVK